MRRGLSPVLELDRQRRPMLERGRAPLPNRPITNEFSSIDRWIVAAALFALAANWLLGTLAALTFIICALVLIGRNPQRGVQDLVRYAPLLAIPVLAVASTLWSPAPQGTLRGSLQLLLTIVAAIIVYRRADPRFVLLILFIAFLGLCISAAPLIPWGLATNRPLAGYFGGKNQMGAAAHLLLALQLAIMLDSQQARRWRLIALCTIPYCIAVLFLSRSATAQAGAGVTVILFPLLLLFGRVPISGRMALFITAALASAVALFFLPDISNAIGDFRQNVLQKNATLTGRTYLWEAAARLTAERPLLGYGYGAFWRPGNLEAEALWRAGGIASNRGFNFHNAFVEMKVDLGLIGQGLLFATCGVFAVVGLFRHLVKPTIPLAFFFSLQVVFYVRS